MHIACVETVTKSVIPSLKYLHKELSKKVKLWDKIIKIGRTHLQDATPLSLGQEFSGFQKQIEFGIKRVELALIRLKYLAQGGTAVGTGLNTKKVSQNYLLLMYLNLLVLISKQQKINLKLLQLMMQWLKCQV